MRIEPCEGIKEIIGPADIRVTPGDIKRYRALKGPQTTLNRRHGEGNWGDDEVRDYIREMKFAEFQRLQTPELGADPVEDRLQEYLEAFEAVTPNDLEMLKAMCHIEVSLESVRESLAKAHKPTEIYNLTQAQTRLLTEHRQLQTILGIDKAGRERDKKTRTALDEIQDLVEEGARFIEEQLTKVTHCGIQIGWLLHDFPEVGYELKTKCPRCGEDVEVGIPPDPSHRSEPD